MVAIRYRRMVAMSVTRGLRNAFVLAPEVR